MSLNAIVNEQSVDDAIYNELINDIEANIAIHGDGLAIDVLTDLGFALDDETYSEIEF